MDSVSVNRFRENLKAFVDRVVGDHEPIKVTRRAGEDFVVISADDWFGEDGWIDWTSDTLWSESCASTDIQDRAQRVVDVYNSARSDSGLAA